MLDRGLFDRGRHQVLIFSHASLRVCLLVCTLFLLYAVGICKSSNFMMKEGFENQTMVFFQFDVSRLSLWRNHNDILLSSLSSFSIFFL